MLHHNLYLGCLLILTVISYVACLTCLKCDSTIKPLFCTEVEQCGPHEVCTTDGYVTPSGAVRYKVGCTDKLFCGNPAAVGKRDSARTATSQLTVQKAIAGRLKREVKFCSECCEGELCNAGGCGNNGFDPNLGPVCYSCASQLGPAGCEHVQQCGRDKVCLISPKLLPGQTDAYITSCEHQRDCNSVRLPTGGGGVACSACCNNSLCNSFQSANDVCNYVPNLVTSAAASTVSTPVITRTTSTTFTTKTSTSTPSTHRTMTYPPVTPTHVSCDKCHHFTLICDTGTSFLQNCIKYCGFTCP